MLDRRGYKRFSQKGSINIKAEGDTPNIFAGILIDIGFRGFCAYLKEKIDVGTPIQFELILSPKQKHLIGRGEIKIIKEMPKHSVYGFRVGVEFTDVKNDDIMLLLGQIQSRIAREKRGEVQDKRRRYREV